MFDGNDISVKHLTETESTNDSVFLWRLLLCVYMVMMWYDVKDKKTDTTTAAVTVAVQ